MTNKTAYVKPFDIWVLPQKVRAAIQIGQWVMAGPDGPKGMYLGQTRSGSDVVAWAGNMKGKKDYVKKLRAYAKNQ